MYFGFVRKYEKYKCVLIFNFSYLQTKFLKYIFKKFLKIFYYFIIKNVKRDLYIRR